MAQQIAADGGNDPRTDDRITAIESITIDFETFKKALKRDYLDERPGDSRNYRLRLSPPFEAEMEASYHEHEQGTYYPPEMSPKPLHIRPHTIITEEADRGFRGIVEYPTRDNTRWALSDEEIEEIGGIDAAVEEGREIFWHELKSILPDEIDLGLLHGYTSHKVHVEWVNVE